MLLNSDAIGRERGNQAIATLILRYDVLIDARFTVFDFGGKVFSKFDHSMKQLAGRHEDVASAEAVVNNTADAE